MRDGNKRNFNMNFQLKMEMV